MPSVRLVVFDCDGTLVDSAATIVACMRAAFVAEGLPPPEPDAVRRQIGLSLAEACLGMMPVPEPGRVPHLIEHYREAFRHLRARPGFDEPLFSGAREVLADLERRGILLGVATGKALPGLRRVLDHHGLAGHFVTLQTADLHPSKPHPAMLEAAMRETGCAPAETVLVGDTTFDIEMAVAARTHPVGVAWGNHRPAELIAAGAPVVLTGFDQLPGHLAGLQETPGPAARGSATMAS